MYRMRDRSNYRDSEMYLGWFEDPALALDYYLALTHVTCLLARGLRAIISRTLGHDGLCEIEGRLPRGLSHFEPFGDSDVDF